MELNQRLRDYGKLEEACPSCGCFLHAVHFRSFYGSEGKDREMMRMRYCMECGRGMVGLDQETFDRLKKLEPLAEFKVHYVLPQNDCYLLEIARCSCGGATEDRRERIGSPTFGWSMVPVAATLW